MKKAILPVLFLLLLPSTIFAQDQLKNGYELYHAITLMDNFQTPDDAFTAMHAMGYLAGYLDGLSFMQDVLFESMFPKKMLSDRERESLSKQMNFQRLNIPKGGIATGQLILIYKKYAEKHPEKLNGTARSCIFESLIEAYGWK